MIWFGTYLFVGLCFAVRFVCARRWIRKEVATQPVSMDFLRQAEEIESLIHGAGGLWMTLLLSVLLWPAAAFIMLREVSR